MSRESRDDMLARLDLMQAGNDQWDLSVNDRAAIRVALAAMHMAPDLLYACEAALPNMRWANLHGSRCDEVIAALESALRKATGETA